MTDRPARRPGAGLVAAAGAIATLLLLPACSPASEEIAEQTSPPRPEVDIPADDFGGGGSGGPDSPEDGTPPEDGTLEIPDMDDLLEQFNDEFGDTIDGFEECYDLAAAYGSLYLQALEGAAGAESAESQGEELKAGLPADLHDDVDTIVAAVSQMAEDGVFGGAEALNSPEFSAADRAITDYINETCGE